MDDGDWDPMMSDYQDAQFNRYIQGVGRDLSNGKWRGAKLYVDNFPVELGQEGLVNLFSEFGHVVEAVLKPSNRNDKKLTYGFVTMESSVAAEHAISRLNQKLFKSGIALKVMPALTDDEKKRRQQAREMEADFMSSIRGKFNRDDDIMSSVSQYSRGPDPHYEQRTFAPRKQGLLDRGDYPGLLDRGDYHFGVNRGRGFHRQADNCDRWDRPDFGMGRGRPGAMGDPRQLPREVNQSYPEMMPAGRGRGRGHLNNNARFSHGPNPMPSDGFNCGRGSVPQAMQMNKPRRPHNENLKICVCCGTEGSLHRCGACKMHYCSPQCQREDWPQHRDICLDVSIHNFKVRTEMEMSSPIKISQKLQHAQKFDRESVASSHSSKNLKQSEKTFDNDGGKRFGSKNFNQNNRGYESESGDRHNKVMKNFKQDKNRNDVHNEATPREPKGKNQENRNGFMNQNSEKDRNVSKTFCNSQNSNKSDKDKQTERAEKFGDCRKDGQGKFNNNNSGRKQGQNKWQERKKQEGPSHVAEGSDKKMPLIKGSTKSPGDIRSKETREDVAGSGDASCDLVNQTMEIGVTGKCQLTHYESPSKLWISMKEDVLYFLHHSDDFKRLLDGKPKGSVKKVQAGDLYCLIHEGFWARVKVITVNEDKTVTVFFPDIGKQECIKISDLYQMDENMRLLPAQAICCCVGKAKPKGKPVWNEKAKDIVKDWLGAPYCKELSFKVMDKKGNSHALELTCGRDDLAEALVSKGVAEISGSSANLRKLSDNKDEDRCRRGNKVERFMAKDLKKQTSSLAEDEKFYININEYECPTCFESNIIKADTEEAMVRISTIIKGLDLDNGKPYSPVQGELVLAKFSKDNVWYRSEIIEVSGEHFTVLFVDYGNKDQLTSKAIRLIEDKSLVEIPSQAITLGLWGSSPCTKLEDIAPLLDDFAVEEGTWSVVFKNEKRGSSFMVDFVSQAKDKSLSTLLNEGLLLKNASPVDKTKASINQKSKATEEISSTTTILTADTPPLDQKTEVFVTFVENLSSFYVMLKSNFDMLTSLMNTIQKEVESMPGSQNSEVGSFVLAKYTADGKWYRAQIKNVKNQDKCAVSFVDFGNCEEVALSGLRLLPSCVLSQPAFAIHCSLDINTVQLSPEANTMFKCFEERPVSVCALRIQKGKCDVKMTLDDGPDVLELMLAEFGTQVSGSEKQLSPSKSVSPTQRDETIIKVDTLTETDEHVSVVIHMESVCDFFIHRPTATADEVSYIHDNMQMKAPNEPHLTYLSEGSYCSALFEEDNIWYRAQIVSVIDSEMCVVKFIDFGNSQKTVKTELRQLPDFDKALPANAISCCFTEFESFLGQGPNKRMSEINASKEFEDMKVEITNAVTVQVTVHGHKSGVALVSLTDQNGEDLLKKFKIPPSSSATTSPNPSVVKSPSKFLPTISDIPVTKRSVSSFEVMCTNMESLSEFSCQEKENDMRHVCELSESLNNDLANVGPGKCLPVVKGGVYGSCYGDQWYRCVVDEVKGERVSIRYIDWGNKEERNAEDLRPLQSKHVSYPLTTINCKLHGIKIMDETDRNMREQQQEYIKILRERLDSNCVWLDIMDQEGDLHCVSLSIVTEGNIRVNIEDDLVNIGIAKSLEQVSIQSPNDKAPEPVEQTVEQTVDQEDEDEDEDERMLKELQRQMEQIQMRKNKKK